MMKRISENPFPELASNGKKSVVLSGKVENTERCLITSTLVSIVSRMCNIKLWVWDFPWGGASGD